MPVRLSMAACMFSYISTHFWPVVVGGGAAHGGLHGRHARVTLLVHAVAEAHDLLFVVGLVQDPLLGLRRVVDLDEVVHHGLVGTTVQGTLEGADGTGDRGVDVRGGGGDHATGEGRGVEGVLGVEDQRLIEGLDVVDHVGRGVRRRRAYGSSMRCRGYATAGCTPGRGDDAGRRRRCRAAWPAG